MDFDRDLLLKTFLEEARENFAVLEETLLALETRPQDADLVTTLFRHAHTFKGNAALVGLQPLADFAHEIEDVLDRLRKGTLAVHGDLISLLLQAVDGLRQMVPEAVAGQDPLTPARRVILQKLTLRATGPGPGPSPEPGSPSAPVPTPASAEEAVPATPHAWSGLERRRTLRVDIEKLDRLLTLSGEIAIARLRVRQALEAAGSGAGTILEADRLTDTLFLDLQEQIIRARMVPVGPVFRQHLRTVRDLARSLGKMARLRIEGGDVEVDTRVVEHLKDPLLHMIRNALDHGIETPDARLAAGKDPCGQIVLGAGHDGSTVVIRLEDDGAGFNRRRIVARAREMGLGFGDPDTLADRDLYRLVFAPGFSTAAAVTDVSGRGVGLDVVTRNLEAMGGEFEVASHEGRGTTITLRIPLTLTILSGLSVGSAGETYVIPLDAVVECVPMPDDERLRRSAAGVINLRGRPLPYLRLKDHFALDAAPGPRENVVVVLQGPDRIGLVVDTLLGEHQAVVKPLGRLFQDLPGVTGSTILGDGRVALILNVATLAHEAAAVHRHPAGGPPRGGAEDTSQYGGVHA